MSNEDTENKALALIIGSKGSRKVNLIEKAEAFQNLYELYKSVEKVSKITGIDKTSVNRYLNIYHLPQEAKNSILEGKIDSYHAAAELARIDIKERLIKTVEQISYIPREEVRDIIRFVINNPELTIENCINQVLRSYSDNATAYVYFIEPSEYESDLNRNSMPRDKILSVLQKSLETSKIYVNFFGVNLVVVLDKVAIKKLGLKANKKQVKNFILKELKKVR